MRTVPHLLSSAVAALISLFVFAVAAIAQQATILKIVGQGSATVSVGGQSQPAREQMAVPLNAEINATGVDVYLQVVPGVVATVTAGSSVTVSSLAASEPQLALHRGRVVSQIDKTQFHSQGNGYTVKMPRGVAAARGTSFTVAVDGSTFSITTTADTVSFSDSSTGASFTIQAGMISITPAGATTPLPPVPIATAVSTNPEVANIISQAVTVVTTVVQNNLGSVSPQTATNLVAQVLAVAVAAVPAQAASFTTLAVTAVTAGGSSTATSSEAAASAAAAITAAAVQSAPDQAAQITGAAAKAAPAGASGIITAAAQQAAPTDAKQAIADSVATATNQSATTVQSGADAASSQATAAVSTAKDATSQIMNQATGQGSSSSPLSPSTQTTSQIPEVQPDVSSAGAH